MKSKKRLGKPLDPVKFVTVWQTAKGTEEVAEKLGLPKDFLIAEAARFRKNKVPLKMMRKGPVSKQDWERLIQLATKYQDEGVRAKVG